MPAIIQLGGESLDIQPDLRGVGDQLISLENAVRLS
jgi:hypothetical protein